MSLAAHAIAANEPLDLIEDGLCQTMGADGVYARGETYERVIEALTRLLSLHRPPASEMLRFPPVMSRLQLEKSGYLMSFPNLLGCVSCLHGEEREIRGAVQSFQDGGSWTEALGAADLVLTPAACYPVYPIAAARGPVPASGLFFDVGCDCFRREPSRDVDRFQSFRMREFVCIGAPEKVLAFREEWMARARDVARALGLAHRVEVASDPFFGRGGQIMAMSQVEQALKFELVIPVKSEAAPTACMSFNYHQDHFGEIWGLRSKTGEMMHTGCVAFGMDRLAVALFAAHGASLALWPSAVKRRLAL
jgi:seryl-tRNA synthetase